jgi:hypothetical protein
MEAGDFVGDPPPGGSASASAASAASAVETRAMMTVLSAEVVLTVKLAFAPPMSSHAHLKGEEEDE